MDSPIKTLEAQLEASRLIIEALESRISELSAEGDHSYIANLKNKHATARGRLNDFKEEGYESWERERADIKNAWRELGNAFRDFSQSTLMEEGIRPRKVKMTRHNENSKNAQTDSPHPPYLGTRISTRVDMLIKNMWIAWNALEIAFRGSERKNKAKID